MTSGNTSTMPEIQEHVIVNCWPHYLSDLDRQSDTLG